MQNEQAKQNASETEAEAAAKSLADDLKTKASQTAEEVKSSVQNATANKRNEAADEVSSIADSLRKAADDMRDGSPQARTMSQIASGFADASDAIRSKDLAELSREVSGFARRNPIAFLGGAALIGFTAARLAKASAKDRARDDRLEARTDGYSGSQGELPSTRPSRNSEV